MSGAGALGSDTRATRRDDLLILTSTPNVRSSAPGARIMPALALLCEPPRAEQIGSYGAGSNLAHGDGGRVSPCLVGGGGEFREQGVLHVSRVESQRRRVVSVESFDEGFGGEGSASGRARFDPCGLVHLVAECGDLTASAG